MIKFIKSFFSKKEEAKVEEVPYKVEASQTYESLKPAKVEAPVADKAVEAVVASIAPAKKTATKKPAKKPAAKKAKAPKAPKAPKV